MLALHLLLCRWAKSEPLAAGKGALDTGYRQPPREPLPGPAQTGTGGQCCNGIQEKNPQWQEILQAIAQENQQIAV